MRPRPHAIDPQQMSVDQMQLIKRMAQNHYERLDAIATLEEVKKYQKDTELLLLIYAALNNAMSELENELYDANLLRHRVKRDFTNASNILYRNFKAVYRAVSNADPRNQAVYDACFIKVSRKIDESILLLPPERGYNIVMALLRLVIRFNSNLGRFVVREASAMPMVLKILGDLKVAEDHHIDSIIERVVRDFNK